jgi:high-affinity iron transporter
VQGIFFGTFLIGLREGLEATLIAGIVGAFLKRNGRSVRPMLAGVAVAVALSIAVGVGLNLLSETLPQAQQEMLETVIGAIAVVFVTTMIIWMNRNATGLKAELERDAQQAINTGGSLALAAMAFLAVLKEGFETAVFLLAAAQTSQGRHWLAMLGASLGIGVAIAVGVGIYYGGLKVNLARFFRTTGVFLVLIAAGLVMSCFRTAHEAGWVTIGQRRLLDFSALMPTRSVLGAFISGMFGIPTDPRLIEVLGWLLYALPVLVVFLWPAHLAASRRARRRLLGFSAAGLAAAAVALAVFVPAAASAGATRSAIDRAGRTVTVALDRNKRVLTAMSSDTRSSDTRSSDTRSSDTRPVRLDLAGKQVCDGVVVDVWQAKTPSDPGTTTATVGRDQLVALTGGRLPVGLGTAPGPFDVRWSASTVYTVRVIGDVLVSADAASNRVATLTGGGLAAPKTVSVGGRADDWATSESGDQAIAARLANNSQDRAERKLWKRWLPAVLAVGAVVLAVAAVRTTHESSENERDKPHDRDPNARDRDRVW